MGVISSICKNKFRLYRTLLAYLAFFTIGSATTLLGSSLLDLQIRLNVDLQKVSYLIPIRSVGHILGSALTGLVDQRFNRSLLLGLVNLVSGIFLGAAPFFTRFELVATFLMIAGVAQGMSDILCNLTITSTWKKNSTNWLQVLYMSWGIGSLITPVISRPFLLPTIRENGQVTSNATQYLGVNKVIVISYTGRDVMVQYVFMIFGVLSISIFIFCTILYLYERSKTEDSEDGAQKPNSADVQVSNSCSRTTRWKNYVAIFLVASISHLTYSLESVVGSLGAAFSVKSDLHLDQKTGVLIATVFWACFSFYRLIFIPLTFIISETKLLFLSLIYTLIGVLLSTLWANSNENCLWAGFVLIGIGISPIFSVSYGMLSKNIIITGKISSIIFIPGIIGESFHPAVAATLLVNNPISFLYYNASLGIALVISYLILMVYCRMIWKTHVDITNISMERRYSCNSTFSVSRH